MSHFETISDCMIQTQIKILDANHAGMNMSMYEYSCRPSNDSFLANLDMLLFDQITTSEKYKCTHLQTKTHSNTNRYNQDELLLKVYNNESKLRNCSKSHRLFDNYTRKK